MRYGFTAWRQPAHAAFGRCSTAFGASGAPNGASACTPRRLRPHASLRYTSARPAQAIRGARAPTREPPVQPIRVDELMVDVGAVDGHRLVLLSVEVYDEWADLRFARLDEGAPRPLTRRIPPAEAWTIEVDGTPAEVRDATGRGDRAFSNGEVRFAPPPQKGSRLTVEVHLRPDADPLSGSWQAD